MIDKALTADGTGGDSGVRYSTKEMFAQIMVRLDTLSDAMARGHSELERRVQTIEARVPLNDELARHVAQISSDFTGFERRTALHEALPHHTEAGVRLKALETAIEHITQTDATTQAVASVLKEIANQNRQMAMFFVSQLLIVLGLLATGLRVWFGH